MQKETAAPQKESGAPRHDDASATLTGGATSAEGARRGERKRKEVRSRAKKDPLRRRILAALVNGPATTAELSERVGSPESSVNRGLRRLEEAGYVEKESDEADGRLRPYSLTVAGEAELNQLTAFGKKRKRGLPTLGPEEAERLLRPALDRAVRIRRQEHRLGEAASRLRGVIREAEKLGASEIVLEATVELAKTLRQERRAKDHKASCKDYEGQLRQLNQVALGLNPKFSAELALPAAAHLRYSLGRAGELLGDDLPTREAHLVAARDLYEQLVKNSGDRKARTDWFRRRAWSIISHAGNLRKQTRLEEALAKATLAKHGFDLVEDEYGRAQSFFMFGFCLRLLGEFHEASTCLDRAQEIAEANSFKRSLADTLMQQGEVKRCLGELGESRELLEKARREAAGMELWVTQAFAESALGALAFQQRELGPAWEYLDAASTLFAECKHLEGSALNDRRRAAVARMMRKEGVKQSYATLERLTSAAREGYAELHSPAGLAACEIEKGRVARMRAKGRVESVIGALNDRLGNRGQREIIELDPWVPQLLRDFAREVEDEQLEAASEGVLATAKDKRREVGTQSVEQVSEVVKEIVLEDEGEIDSLAAEMGGEARRERSAFEGRYGSAARERDLKLVAA
ncbi:MAG TPA: MarR family transcriptional regulator [Solirubrobacterales bacterium]|nr:MarR family transcriptional regulator [Solirubrobacterales bacterium]